MKIWPAIDLFQGKVVRLTRGDYSARTEYADDPLSVAMAFQSEGCPRLHVVDLEGARKGIPCHAEVLPSLSALNLTIRYGGGLRTVASIEKVLSMGAAFAMVGSLLLATEQMPFELFAKFGERIIPTVDIKMRQVAVSGWTEKAALGPEETLQRLLVAGFRHCLVTAVDRDGTGEGPDLDLYETLRKAFPEMEFTAAGGIRNLQDIRALAGLGISDVVVGKALYEGNLNLKDAQEVDRPC
ncbi:MAG: 1-(5-phosphoribosyl)-5-[(5-phosphoribosylamino)methylideneamino] imidazole-4-carboxamide isomerase [Synergistaceae bacterium]|nr:1-(5-phosphoribosyl)-5-[(5-phosphoribosylamino)methylideneamino] imidazole-4-carboxamide isomerase [Synergistaceae bacterium]